MEKKEDLLEIEEERAFSNWLCNIEGIGRKRQRKLLEEAGSARNVFAMKEKELERCLPPQQRAALLSSRKKGIKQVWAEHEKMKARGICHYPFHDPRFPERLRKMPDPPVGIYVYGSLPEENRASVAVIGARACSEYGRYAARYFAGALAEEGVHIISGLARGIDGIGQQAALEAGGQTYAVMGCGADICYPQENGPLYEMIRRRGGILSEYPPGTPPKAGLFPQRNRIISALSDVVLVIEARERSGTLITVDMALEQGKDVAVVPGRITDRLSLGCNRLIRQGAVPVLSPQDILELLGDRTVHGSAGRKVCEEGDPRCGGAVAGEGCFDDTQASFADIPLSAAVARILDYTPMTVGQIRERLEALGRQQDLPQVMQALLELVLEGRCIEEAGRYGLAGNS